MIVLDKFPRRVKDAFGINDPWPRPLTNQNLARNDAALFASWYCEYIYIFYVYFYFDL